MIRKAEEGKLEKKLEIRGQRLTTEKNTKESEKVKVAEQKIHDKRQNYQQLCRYNPWGKPGGGAPNDVRKRQKFLETQGQMAEIEFADALQSSLSFGRPGHGAPLVTKSGRLRSQITGDPVIRFQDSQNVHKSVENGIRYFRGRKAQDEYKNELDTLVQQKMSNKVKENEMKIQLEEHHEKYYPFGHESEGGLSASIVSAPDSIFTSTSPHNLLPPPTLNVSTGYDPWGKGFGTPRRDHMGNVLPRISPSTGTQETIDWEKYGLSIPLGKYSGGDGSPHMANKAATSSSNTIVTKLPCTLNCDGVKGLDLTVNVASGSPQSNYEQVPSPRTKEKQTFLEKLGWNEEESKMSEEAKKDYLHELKIAIEEKSLSNRKELEEEKYGGIEFAQLMRDKKVGYPNRRETQLFKLNSTDITKAAPLSCPVIHWSNAEYRDELDKQKESRLKASRNLKEKEMVDSEKHFETWDSMWGRPGHGAPKDPSFHRKEGVGHLYKVHSKIPLLPTSRFATMPINYRRRHRSLNRDKQL